MHLRLIRTSRATPLDRAAALDSLASLLRSGLTPPEALQEWPDLVATSIREGLRKTARLSKLGLPAEQALRAASDALGDDLDAVRVALQLHERTGANPIPLIRRAAMLSRSRAESDASGRAAAAGAKLSGWMVGGLPLVALPLVPLGRAPMFDPAGLVLLFLGLSLTVGGMVWMLRLVPRVPTSDDPVAAFLDHVVAALCAGVPLAAALELTCELARGDLYESLARARRQAALGRAWPDALLTADPSLSDACAALHRAERFGTPPGPTLEAVAEVRRAEARQEFERRVKRAPVLMVVPLVLCVLPAFGLLAVVPFLRGVAFG
jgi:Flp pilus assembly protein TadB